MERIVEAFAVVDTVEDEGAVVVNVGRFNAVEDGIVFVLFEAAVIVGLVDLYITHKIVKRGTNHNLFLRVGEGGNRETEGVNLRKVEAEVVVEEGGVGDVHFETAYVNVTGKQDVAVTLNDDVATVGFDNDKLTIANNEFLDAMDTEIERGKIKFSIVLLGIGLKGKGIVVMTLLLDDSFVEANEFVVDMDTGATFVVGDETVTG